MASPIRPSLAQRLLDIPVSDEIPEHERFCRRVIREEMQRMLDVENIPLMGDSGSFSADPRLKEIGRRITRSEKYIAFKRSEISSKRPETFLKNIRINNPYFNLPENTKSSEEQGLDNYLCYAVEKKDRTILKSVLLAKKAFYIDREHVYWAYHRAKELACYDMAKSIDYRYQLFAN